MSKRSRTGYESPLISAALVSSLAVLDIPPQSVRLGPRGAALHTLHWVAGDSHRLEMGSNIDEIDCIIHNYQKLMMLVPMPITQLNGRMRHMT